MKRAWIAIIWMIALLWSGTPIWATTTGVVVTGLGGTEDYASDFRAHGQSITDTLRSLSANASDFVWLDGAELSREQILDRVAEQSDDATDAFVLILLGHGSVDAETWRFNIRGSDITTADLVAVLAPVQVQQQIVVVSTSASGALLRVMAQPGRILVTATKSGGEINAVRFSDYLADALASDSADIDRNEILTVAEVFRYANEKTAAYYEERNLLASEHARLLGEQADRQAMARLGALREAQNDPAVAGLLETRLELENAFHALKARKSSLSQRDYYAELEPLLVSIAQLQRDIDLATGWSDPDD